MIGLPIFLPPLSLSYAHPWLRTQADQLAQPSSQAAERAQRGGGGAPDREGVCGGRRDWRMRVTQIERALSLPSNLAKLPLIGNMLMMDPMTHCGLAKLVQCYSGLLHLCLCFNHTMLVYSLDTLNIRRGGGGVARWGLGEPEEGDPFFAFLTILKSSAALRLPFVVAQLHTRAICSGYHAHPFDLTSLISAYPCFSHPVIACSAMAELAFDRVVKFESV